MHLGAIPYVDVWDRKPPGLFALYYLFAGISHSVLSFQLGGWLSVSATALAIWAIARKSAGAMGAIVAATLYLALLPAFGGRGGQAPIFYNLLVALAAMLVLRCRIALGARAMPGQVMAAMLLLGIALTLKQTVLPEALFWGSYALWQMARGGAGAALLGRRALMFAAAGAAPMLACAAIYAAIGHFDAFWHAMVTANLTKAYNPGHDLLRRAWSLFLLQSPAWAMAALGLLFPAPGGDRGLRLASLGWFIASLAGVFVIPNLHYQYVLSMLGPLSLMTAPWAERRLVGPVSAGAYIAAVLVGTSAFDFGRAARSNAMVRAMVAGIERRDPHPRLFVFDGPVYLYALTGAQPQSPLFFPQHLYFLPERNTSWLDTDAVVRQWLARRPSVIVIRHPDPGETRFQYDRVTLALAEAYAKTCRWHFVQTLQNMILTQPFDVYGGCGTNYANYARPSRASSLTRAGGNAASAASAARSAGASSASR